MSNKIICILADGFEEIEAVTPIDFLRRLGLEIVIAGLGNRKIKGSHGIVLEADLELADLAETPKALILPGGMPGSTNLRDNELVIKLIQQTFNQGNLVAAICAAPIAMDKAGILKGKTITAHPSVRDSFAAGVTYTGNGVEQDGNIITAKGAGVAFDFASKIAEYYNKKFEAKALSNTMFVI